MADNDSEHPADWPLTKKYFITAVLSAMMLVTDLAITMIAPGVRDAMTDFNSTNSLLSVFAVSIYVLGFVICPLILEPLSEIYGRKPVHLISHLLFIAFSIGCAMSTNISILVAFRFLTGCAGSVPDRLGFVTIREMFRGREDHEWAVIYYKVGPIIAAVASPVIGGYLTQLRGWRWVFWLQAILGGVTLIMGFIFLKETNHTASQQRQTNTVIRRTGNTTLISALLDFFTLWKVFRCAIVRLIKSLFLSPTIFFLNLFVAILNGYLSIFFTYLPFIFGPGGVYNFKPGSIGLIYLGLGIGYYLGFGIMLFIASYWTDLLSSRRNGVSNLEINLWPTLISCPLTAVTLFWFGWTARQDVCWIVPVLASIFFTVAMTVTCGIPSLYLQLKYSSEDRDDSPIIAGRLLRSLGGALIPLAGPPLFNHLGLGWGFSLLGFLALAIVSMPWLFIRYRERL